jgi:hypothetical protein
MVLPSGPIRVFSTVSVSRYGLGVDVGILFRHVFAVCVNGRRN